MASKELINKPLVEAMLEVKWKLIEDSTQTFSKDPHYRLLLGRLFDRIKETYSFHEPLPTSEFPDHIVAHTVQHRFRVEEGCWPLLQLGPGIMTVNETSGYKWNDFKNRCEVAVQNLYETHPQVKALQLEDVTLRYINAIKFDVHSNNVFSFLSDKMKSTIQLPENLFKEWKKKPNPETFHWETSFASDDSKSFVTLRYSTGKRNEENVLFWEILIRSTSKHSPQNPKEFSSWLVNSHNTIDDWFFKLIEGDLKQEFSNE